MFKRCIFKRGICLKRKAFGVLEKSCKSYAAGFSEES